MSLKDIIKRLILYAMLEIALPRNLKMSLLQTHYLKSTSEGAIRSTTKMAKKKR